MATTVTLTTTPATLAGPECRETDQIIRWDDVLVGDLVLYHGELETVTGIKPRPCGYDPRLVLVLIDGSWRSLLGERYTAVRRYYTEDAPGCPHPDDHIADITTTSEHAGASEVEYCLLCRSSRPVHGVDDGCGICADGAVHSWDPPSSDDSEGGIPGA